MLVGWKMDISTLLEGTWQRTQRCLLSIPFSCLFPVPTFLRRIANEVDGPASRCYDALTTKNSDVELWEVEKVVLRALCANALPVVIE